MKRLLMSLLSVFFPWIVLLLNDNPGGALVALIMQVTIIGWPFAALWALKVEKEHRLEKRNKKYSE